jgi:Flp pilus assembly protein TadD
MTEIRPAESDRARARRLAIAGDFGPEALALNVELLSIDPNDQDARTRLARCYREAGRIDEARSEYEEVLRDPGQAADLVRLVARVFTGLLPLYRAILGPSGAS